MDLIDKIDKIYNAVRINEVEFGDCFYENFHEAIISRLKEGTGPLRGTNEDEIADKCAKEQGLLEEQMKMKIVDKCAKEQRLKNTKLFETIDDELKMYKTRDIYGNTILDFPHMQKNYVEELAKKHKNYLISEYGLDDISKYGIGSLKSIFKNKYIEVMIESEFNDEQHTKMCFSEEIINKYNKILQSEIDFNKRNNYYPLINKKYVNHKLVSISKFEDFPSHMEYLNCAADRHIGK